LGHGLTGKADGNHGITGAVPSERRNRNLREYGAHVDFAGELQQVAHRRRTGRLTFVARLPNRCLGVAEERGRREGNEGSGVRSPSPVTNHIVQGWRRSAGRVFSRIDAGRRTFQEKAVQPFRIGHGEEHRHRASLRYPIEEGAVDAGSIHHGSGIIHSRVDRGHRNSPVGSARASLVEQHDTSKRS
jgi:hypothetical protein